MFTIMKFLFDAFIYCLYCFVDVYIHRVDDNSSDLELGLGIGKYMYKSKFGNM